MLCVFLNIGNRIYIFYFAYKVCYNFRVEYKETNGVMGILVDALAISGGILLGSCYKNKLKFKINQYFAIAVMIISLLGLIENVFVVSEHRILGSDMIVVVLSMIIGSALGDFLRLEDRLNHFGKGASASKNGFLDAVFLFGIGGLQIGGPILMAVSGDNSQLYLKAMVDFPLALLTGAAYGKMAMLSCIPVAMIQGAVALAAYFCGPFISEAMLMSLCSIGFIILFFTGFNMISSESHKIKNTNMLPAVLFVILFYVMKGILL